MSDLVVKGASPVSLAERLEAIEESLSGRIEAVERGITRLNQIGVGILIAFAVASLSGVSILKACSSQERPTTQAVTTESEPAPTQNPPSEPEATKDPREP